MNKARFNVIGNTIYLRNKVKGVVFKLTTSFKLPEGYDFIDNRVQPFDEVSKPINFRIMEMEKIFEACHLELTGELTHHKFKDLFNRKLAGQTTSSDSIKQLAEDYISGLADGSILSASHKTYTKDSVRAMKTSVKLIQEFARHMVLQDLSKATGNEFIAYLNKNKTASINTIRKHVKVLKTFGNWLYRRDLLEYNFSREWKKPSEPELMHTWLTNDEFEKVLNCKKELNIHVGFYFLMIIQFYTGLRVSDLIDLKPIHIKDKRINKRLIKTKVMVSIPINDRLLWWTNNWFEAKMGMEPFTHQDYNEAIKHICYKSGIDEMIEVSMETNKGTITDEVPKWQAITSHSLRRSMLTNGYLAGMPRKFLMLISGHKTEASLNKYLLQSNIQLTEEFDINKYQ